MLSQGLVLPLSPPRGAPLGSLPSLGDVNRLSGYLVASEFENVDAVVPGSAVIPDRVLHHPEVSLASYPSDLELYCSVKLHLTNKECRGYPGSRESNQGKEPPM